MGVIYLILKKPPDRVASDLNDLIQKSIRTEFQQNREELSKNLKENRQELTQGLERLTEKMEQKLAFLNETLNANAKVKKFVLDQAHTNITWSANHAGFSNPNGKFSKSSGAMFLDESNPESSSVEIEIDNRKFEYVLGYPEKTLIEYFKV